MELAEVGAGRRRAVQEPASIGYIDGESLYPGCAVEYGPRLVPFKVDEFDMT